MWPVTSTFRNIHLRPSLDNRKTDNPGLTSGMQLSAYPYSAPHPQPLREQGCSVLSQGDS